MQELFLYANGSWKRCLYSFLFMFLRQVLLLTGQDVLLWVLAALTLGTWRRNTTLCFMVFGSDGSVLMHAKSHQVLLRTLAVCAGAAVNICPRVAFVLLFAHLWGEHYIASQTYVILTVSPYEEEPELLVLPLGDGYEHYLVSETRKAPHAECCSCTKSTASRVCCAVSYNAITTVDDRRAYSLGYCMDCFTKRLETRTHPTCDACHENDKLT